MAKEVYIFYFLYFNIRYLLFNIRNYFVHKHKIDSRFRENDNLVPNVNHFVA